MSSKQTTSASQTSLSRAWNEYRLYDALVKYSDAERPTSTELRDKLLGRAAMQKVSIHSALFIRAFGRDDLTDDDICLIGVIIDAAVTQSDPDTFTDIHDLLRGNDAYQEAIERSEQAGVNKIVDGAWGVKR